MSSNKDNEGKNDEKCPKCGNINTSVDLENDEITCTKCGFILNEKKPAPKEKISTDKDGNMVKKRGPPSTYQQTGKGLKTSINRQRYSENANEQKNARRLKYIEKRTWYKPGERALSNMLKELDRICSILSCSDTLKETASKIGRKVVKNKLTKGRPIEATAGATIVIAGHRVEERYSAGQVSKIAGVERQDVNKAIGRIIKELDINIVYPTYDSLLPSYISQVMEIYEIPNEDYGQVYNIANKITEEMEEERMITGKNQHCIAVAGAIVALRRLGYDIPVVSELLNITDSSRATIYKRIKEIEKVEEKIDEDIADYISDYRETVT